MSTKTGPRNSSSSNSKSNSNNMPAQRGSPSRRISESTSLGITSTTSTSTSVNPRQQHVADKSAVKRKKRRKDEGEKAVAERVPVVLITRLEDERKSNETKGKQVTDIKVVIERANDIESIKASSSDKSVPAGKKSTRHSIHRSSENLASSDAKTLEPIREEKKVEVKDSVKALPKKSIESVKSSEQTECRSSKVKSVQKPSDNLVECNVHNVNNDNLKTIDPKITERQLLVRLDRSEVKNFLEKKPLQRLHNVDNSIAETNKYHSESGTQDNDVLSKISKEIKTCAIPSDDGVADNTKIQNDLIDKSQKFPQDITLPKIDVAEETSSMTEDESVDHTVQAQSHVKRRGRKSLKHLKDNNTLTGFEKNQEDAKSMTANVVNNAAHVAEPYVERRGRKPRKPSKAVNVLSTNEIDVTDRVEEVQQNVVKPVEIKVKRKERSCRHKDEEETAKSVVENQRLSSREKRKAKSQEVARESNKDDSDKDLTENTKIHEGSSVQMNENQIEHLDDSPKDTSCESTTSNKVDSHHSLSKGSESLNESAVVDSEEDSSKISKTEKIINEIIDSNLSSENLNANDDSSIVAETVPVLLPMEVAAVPHDHTVADDSKAVNDSAQQICDIHSKTVNEDAETLPDETETLDKRIKKILLKSTKPFADNLMDSESTSIENLINIDSTEFPVKTSEESEMSESLSKNLQASGTFKLSAENLVNGEVIESSTDSFVSCENVEHTNEESISENNESLIEAIEDTESTASTCTLIEETPEELSQNVDGEMDTPDELPEDADRPSEISKELTEEVYKKIDKNEEQLQVAEKEVEIPKDDAVETSFKTNRLDESFTQEDKIAECNEHESTYENNLKSVENLVIDSILNGEIASPKIIVQSAASRVEEAQSFVFESSVVDYVNEANKETPASLEPSSPVEQALTVENLEPSATVEASPAVQTFEPLVAIEEPALVKDSGSLVSLERPMTLPLKLLPTVEHLNVEENKESSTDVVEKSLESSSVIEKAANKDIFKLSTPIEDPIDHNFTKHRRKHTLLELKKKCTENIGRRQAQALETACNDIHHDEPLPANTFGDNHLDVNNLQVPSSVLSSECYPEPTTVSNKNYFENISDAESEICLSDRLNQLAGLNIPSLDEPSLAEKSAISDSEESSGDHTKRQRILMKITKTDANKHVTHLVQSKEDEEEPSTEQFSTEQVAGGDIKIIVCKESSSNNHVIKEIKITPRTPDGGNSARIPGYSPTSSDLSSGNSSCRVPSCSPAKPDCGSYRMPGWSPASTEIGHATMKKKQGRPKKYPIFTDAELIAKTTAIVNNVDVHANKLTEEPLFQPVESIRINEDEEVEDEEDEQQNVITEQTCLSSSQLLEAMPPNAEILAKFAKKIEDDQTPVKKKKVGRPRQYPLTEDVDMGTKPKVTENVTVARIEFSVVDSVTEFVEPVKQIDSILPATALKKKGRGRPRKEYLRDASAILIQSRVEESNSVVENVLIHDVPSKKQDRKSRRLSQDDSTLLTDNLVEKDANSSMTEDEAVNDALVVKSYVEKRGRKPWKHLKNINKPSQDQVIDEAESAKKGGSVIDALVTAPYIEKRGRKPWKHLKKVNGSSDNQVSGEADSVTEDEVVNDALVVKPYVERRGRKPWKHLKNIKKSSESQVAEEADSQTEDEAVTDAPVPPPYVERRGRKPWKHLKDVKKSSENQVVDDAQSAKKDQVITDAPVLSPYIERRGRKPWKHLKDITKSSESQVAQEADSQTEDEAVTDDPVLAPDVERRVRKTRKHLKDINKSSESQVVEEADSQTEDEAVTDASIPPPYVERRGRKPWKHLKDVKKSSESQVPTEADSQTEDEAVTNTPVPSPYVERRRHKSGKYLKNINKSDQNEAAEQENTTIENEAVSDASTTKVFVERRGRKPSKHFKDANALYNNQSAEETNSQTQDETIHNNLETEHIVEKRRSRKAKQFAQETTLPENAVAQEANSMTEDESNNDPLDDLPYIERISRKSLKVNALPTSKFGEETNLQTENETIHDNLQTEQTVKKQGRPKLQKIVQDITISENEVAEDESSLTENESADDTMEVQPRVERRGRKPLKHLKDNSMLSIFEKNQEDISATTPSAVINTAHLSESYVERRGRKPWKNLKDLNKSSENQASVEENSTTGNESNTDASPTKPCVERKVRKQIEHLKILLPQGEKKKGRPMKNPTLLNKTSESLAEEEVKSLTQNVLAVNTHVTEPYVERRGRKPYKHLKDARTLLENQVIEDTSSIDENKTVNDNVAVEPVVQNQGLSGDDTMPSENVAAKEASSVIAVSNTSTSEPLQQKVSNTEIEITNGTPVAEVIVKKKRSRKSHNNLQDTSTLADNSVADDANLMTEDESTCDTLVPEQIATKDKTPVVKKRKRGSSLKFQPAANGLSDNQAAKEASSMTEDENADDTSTSERPIVKKRGGSRKHSQDDCTVPENLIADEASSITEDRTVNDTPAVETLVKNRGRPRKIPEDDSTSFENVVAEEDTRPLTEDETVSSTEDIPTGDNLLSVKKRGLCAKSPKTITVTSDKNQQLTEEPSSMTEDETVSSTEDIPTVEQQPAVKKNKVGRPRKILKNVSTPSLEREASESIAASSADDSTAAMEPPVVRKRGRPRKICLQAKNTLANNNESIYTTEDETVSSTEDVPIGEQPVVKKNKCGRPRKNLPVPVTESEMSESLAASSIEDLSTLEVSAAKKRGKKSKILSQNDNETTASATEEISSIAASSMENLSSFEQPAVVKKKRNEKPRSPIQDDSACSDSLAASSMEDLSALSPPPPVLVRKRGRPPKSLSSIGNTLKKTPVAESTKKLVTADVHVDSIEEFSPVKAMSPVKKKRQQPDETQEDVVTPKVLEQVSAALYQTTFDSEQPVYAKSVTSPSPVKKRGRPLKYPRKEIDTTPKQVSSDESQRDNAFVPKQQQPLEKRIGRLPRRLSQDENILPSIIKIDAQSNETPGRSPRLASHDSDVLSAPVFIHAQQSENEIVSAVPNLGKRQGRPPRKFSPDEEHSFSALPQSNHVQNENDLAKKPGRPAARKYSHDDSLPMPQFSISDSDDASSAKRKGRPPKKFTPDDSYESSPIKKKGRAPKSVHDESLPLARPLVNDSEDANDLAKKITTTQLQQVDSVPIVPPLVISNTVDTKTTRPLNKDGVPISTTNLLRQQRKPKMAQPQPQVVPPTSAPVPVATAVETRNLPHTEPLSALTPTKKRNRQPKLPNSDGNTMSKKKQVADLPDDLTIEQLRQRRHSQDDSMFTEELPKLLKKRSKEFEDAQPKKKRGRPPKMRELSRHFILSPKKPKTVDEAIAQAVSPNNDLVLEERKYQRMGRPRKLFPTAATTVQEKPSGLTAADFLRTWTDRDESPNSQSNKKPVGRQRRFSQDDSVLAENFVLGESRPSSRNRLRRYSQGDALDETSSDGQLITRKRVRSSGSDSSIVQDEKRPRVEKELCTQHSITKELVVQLTKIDKREETHTEPIREIVKMSLRRKLESNNNANPPPLVPIEPNRLQPPQPPQPPTHSDAKLLMLMQPTEDKPLLQATPQLQPPTQQFCIIFIPDALTSAESALNKDSQPTATIVNFQPVPDSELANKSVIYTPTTPTKIFVNEEQHNRSFLCATCTQALDLVGRMEANVGMTEEDKSAIKCPYCSNDFQSLFYLEYHLRQEHLKCENEKQCRHSGFNTLRIPSLDSSSESEIYITFALKCRSCYELFESVLTLNEHVKAKHANLIRHKPPLSQFSTPGMVCYPPPPFKNGARPEVLHCPSDCICRIGIRSTDSPMQRAQVLKRCPNFMRRLEKIEAAAYEVYTCMLCRSTFLMKDEVVEHLMKMHEVSCKFPCTRCLTSFRSVQLQEAHHCSETTIRDLDKLINIVILPTDKAQDNSKFEDSSNDELGPIKTTPPPAVPSASTPLNGVKRKNGVVIQRLSKYLSMQPPKKPKLDGNKRQKTPCPKCQKKFAYRKSLNDHIIFEHIIPCKADQTSKNMAVELLRLVNNGATDVDKIEELATALGKYTDDDGVSLRKLTMIDDEQENWNDAQLDKDAHNEKDLLQCFKCKANFKLPANSANLSRRNNQQSKESPSPQLCERCDPTRRRRNVVNNGHNMNLKSPTNGEQETQQQQVRYLYECDCCSDSFPTTIELNRHKSDEHSNKSSDALKCDVCTKIFYSPRMLEKHKKMHHDDSLSNSRIEEDENMECNNQSVGDGIKDSETNDAVNSSTSRRDSSDNNKEEEKCNCPCCDFSAEKVSLKNHLKREHGVMAFICQFCGKLLVEISEVRHMLDYHIKSSRKGGHVGAKKTQDDVDELLKTLGKKRLQSLMIYHDFEGKCNNAIMRCPICPEQFATRESCRHHYQWMHDSTCILCDANFAGGNVAGQHKVAVHNSIASYVWAIQHLVSAIVHGLRLDRAHPSNVLYQEVSMRLDMLEEESAMSVEGELPVARSNINKTGSEEVVPEPFLEPVVLSEDQLPGSGNMIEVVIGNDMVVEDSEDNLLEDFYLSPNYESSCEQPRILDAGAPIPELEEEEEVVATVAMAATTTACATVALPTTPNITTSNGGILIPTAPVTAETYATSAVFKLRQDNGQEEVVLAITDEDLVTYRDDIGSLAERLSSTCDSLSLEEITTMLSSYFENIGTSQSEEVELAAAIEPRTQ